ncbi:MAG: tRNA (N6-isopentenyl adenosine(37)-C2)-methylthiotransferase MiaB [Clostridia bacterium]|nr:tRNA (N6-isopentenyl adenosine(37)-C2)-methylthiotransferase MiaB [Clostridia bacterium]
MNYYIKTYGCQMNVHESEKIANILVELGYQECTDMSTADIIVFNTCCIRGTAEDKIKAHIGEVKHIKKANPNLIVAVCGCMSQQEGVAQSLLNRFPFINIVLGTTNLHLLKERIAQVKNSKRYANTDYCHHAELESYRTSTPNGWVNIIYGCNNYCTYCIVPHVRGREQSRQEDNIVDEVTQLLENGYKEITLLGQNVNSYGKDLNDGSSFAGLLNRLAELPYRYRLRFITSHPKDLSDEVIDAIARHDNICKSIHLPVQSGSTDILRRMNRRYTREDYIALVDRIRASIPNVGITSDIMVGFPNETEQDFFDTLDLVNRVRFSSLFCFIYSRRKGTPAYSMDNQVSIEVKRDRIKRLITTQNIITNQVSQEYHGKVYEILVEDRNDKYDNTYCGRTDCGRLVNFGCDTDLIGQFVNVRIRKSASATLWGDLVMDG